LFSLDRIAMRTPDEGNTILQILRARCGKWTVAELHDGRSCRVFDIAWGRDIAADFDHITTNISPGLGGDATIDSFHTSDVALLRDEETGSILFGHATRAI
jgi:hypothetical protein